MKTVPPDTTQPPVPASTSGDTATTATPGAPTGADADALAAMLGIELAAGELYRAAGDAGATTGNPDLFAVIGDSHDAYAESLAALVGLPVSGSIDAAFVDARRPDFESSDVAAVADAGYVLESELVRTYTELVGSVANVDAASLAASILIVESRHCTIMADLAGRGNDLTALLDNDATPLDVAGEPGS